MWSIGKKSLGKIWRRKCTVFTSTGANPYAAYKPFSRINDCCYHGQDQIKIKTSDGVKEYSESLKKIDEISLTTYKNIMWMEDIK